MPNLRLAAFNTFPDHGTLRLVAGMADATRQAARLLHASPGIRES